MFLATLSGSSATRSELARMGAADRKGARIAAFQLRFCWAILGEIGSELSRRDFQLGQRCQLLRREFLPLRCRVPFTMYDNELILQQAPPGKPLARHGRRAECELQFAPVK